MISARPKAVLLIAAAACGLASCQQQKTPDTVAERSPAPEAKPGIMVSQGALVLPAVKRNPGAAYFTLANGSNAPVTLAAVTIDRVGKTEMHESVGGSMAPLKTLTVAPGATVRLERGGKHVMLFDIAPSV